MSYTVPIYEHSVHLDCIPDFTLTSVNENIQVEVFPDTLYQNAIFTSTYVPDLNNEVSFNLSDIFRNFLHTELPNASVFLQQNIYKSFGFVIRGLTSNTQNSEYYDVLLSKADVDVTPYVFMQSNFLTLQPKSKMVKKDMPEHLTLFGIGQSTSLQLYARFYPKAGGSSDVQLSSPSATGINTFRFFWQDLWQLRPVASNPVAYFDYIDIVANDGKDDVMIQRYIYKQKYGSEHYFLWVNALGGIDTICCSGDNSLVPQVTHNVGIRNTEAIQLDDSDDYRKWNQQSGWFPWKQREWLWDFMSSKLKHWIYDPISGTYTEIVVTSAEMEASDHGQLVQFAFTYRLAKRGHAVGTSSRESTFSKTEAESASDIDYDDTQETPEE